MVLSRMILNPSARVQTWKDTVYLVSTEDEVAAFTLEDVAYEKKKKKKKKVVKKKKKKPATAAKTAVTTAVQDKKEEIIEVKQSYFVLRIFMRRKLTKEFVEGRFKCSRRKWSRCSIFDLRRKTRSLHKSFSGERTLSRRFWKKWRRSSQWRLRFPHPRPLTTLKPPTG